MLAVVADVDIIRITKGNNCSRLLIVPGHRISRRPGYPHVFRVLLLLILLFAGNALSRATTVIAVWTPSGIYIGADGLWSSEGGPIPSRGCKLQRVGNIIVAHAGGGIELHDGSTGKIIFTLDGYASIRQAARSQGSIETRITRLDELYLPSYRDWLESMPLIASGEALARWWDFSHAAAFLMAGTDAKGHPIAVTLVYSATRSPTPNTDQ